jgi:hypothetical protein
MCHNNILAVQNLILSTLGICNYVVKWFRMNYFNLFHLRLIIRGDMYGANSKDGKLIFETLKQVEFHSVKRY